MVIARTSGTALLSTLRQYDLSGTGVPLVVSRPLCRWWTPSRFIHDRTTCATSVKISSHTLPGGKIWGLAEVSTSAFGVKTSCDRKAVLSMGDAWA